MLISLQTRSRYLGHFLLAISTIAILGASAPDHWDSKAVLDTKEAAKLVGGFSTKQARLYENGVIRIVKRHGRPGQYTIHQVIERERNEEKSSANHPRLAPHPTPPTITKRESTPVSFIVILAVFLSALAAIVWGVINSQLKSPAIKSETDAANAAFEAERVAAREAADLANLKRSQETWDAAAKAGEATAVYTTSLLLRSGENIGYAALADRILTHKVGHKVDRVSSHTGTSAATSKHASTGASTGASIGMWGARQGRSQQLSNGVAQNVASHSSSGSGQSYSQDVIRTEVVDSGQLVLTNQRVVFMGDNATMELPADKVIGFHFTDDDHLVIDYAKRPMGECFKVPDPLAMKMAMARRLHEPGVDVPPRPTVSDLEHE